MNGPDERPSRSELKRRSKALQGMGERLAKLPAEVLRSMDLPADLRDALLEWQGLKKHEARRRQMQYVGRIMRELDPEPIEQALEAYEREGRVRTEQFHDLEQLREKLLADDAALGRLKDEHPEADAQRLNQLIRQARTEQAAGKPPKAYRALFRALRDLLGQ